jgi:hypothetical protein
MRNTCFLQQSKSLKRYIENISIKKEFVKKAFCENIRNIYCLLQALNLLEMQ